MASGTGYANRQSLARNEEAHLHRSPRMTVSSRLRQSCWRLDRQNSQLMLVPAIAPTATRWPTAKWSGSTADPIADTMPTASCPATKGEARVAKVVVDHAGVGRYVENIEADGASDPFIALIRSAGDTRLAKQLSKAMRGEPATAFLGVLDLPRSRAASRPARRLAQRRAFHRASGDEGRPVRACTITTASGSKYFALVTVLAGHAGPNDHRSEVGFAQMALTSTDKLLRRRACNYTAEALLLNGYRIRLLPTLVVCVESRQSPPRRLSGESFWLTTYATAA